MPGGGGGSADCCFAGGRLGACRLGCGVAVPVTAGGVGPDGSLAMMLTGGIEAADGRVYFGSSGTPAGAEVCPAVSAADGGLGAGVSLDGAAAATGLLAPSDRQLAA